MLKLTRGLAFLLFLFVPVVFAQQPQPYVYVPPTVSSEWQQMLAKSGNPTNNPAAPAANDIEAWKKAYDDMESAAKQWVEPMLKRYQPTVSKQTMGGVPVLDVKPKGWEDNKRILVYVHGGAYTYFSAYSTLGSSMVAAEATGLRVISVDYTVAPAAKWQQITDQVIAVFEALRKEGYSPKQVAIYGDSAGGGLAAGVVLKMRDKGLPLPAAVVLWSPWSDITDVGDTYTTLKSAEPAYLYEKHLKACADSYADPKDQKHPYVSPVYGDYSKGFPPTLIQGGTKEIFLSNFIRQYQAIDTAGGTVKLDLYEGMPHVFQAWQPDFPEGKLALAKMRTFLRKNMGLE